MLDIRFVIGHPDVMKSNLEKRFQADKVWMVDELCQDYELWRELKQDIDNLRHQRNELSSEVNTLKKQGKDASKILGKVKDIPLKIKGKEDELVLLQEKMDEKLAQLPNVMHESVPKGKDASKNVEVRKQGKAPKFTFEVRSHGDLAEALGVVDFDAGREVSGEGFNYLLGGLAKLDVAIQRYGLDFVQQHGFNLVVPPILVRRKAMEGVVNFSDFKETIYKVQDDDLYLVGTAENSLIPLYMGKNIDVNELPVKVAALTPCFRRETGAHGVDTKGLFRMHQFYKVEQVVFSHPDSSFKLLEEMNNISEKFFKSLEIPTRTIEICSGDLGSKQAKQYDIEAWFPRQKAYKEVTSASNCTDYQARKLGIKVVKNGEKVYAHILNNTMVATSRVMVAILENFQQKDGSVKIPDVLQKYAGLKKISKN